MCVPIVFRCQYVYPLAGLADTLLSKMARCGKSRSDSHTCRNLHHTIRKFQKSLPVRTSKIPTEWLRKKKRHRVEHPVLYPSSWAELIFSNGGHFFLQGKDLSQSDWFSNTLVDFWTKFSATHPEYGLPESRWDHTIPIALHGDEGRGRLKHPVMVMSLQPLPPLRPEFKTNMQGCPDLHMVVLMFY